MSNIPFFRGRDGLATVLLILITFVLVDQARFLFVYPVPDTGMWFGDESWTMLTLRALARSGIARVPEAIGSSLAHSNGLINGSIWISGLIYGVQAAIWSHVASPVAIGRTITFILSLILLYCVYRLARRIGASPAASLLGVLVLVISKAFYFSSHSARLDTATGLAVVMYLFLLVFVLEETQAGRPIVRWAFLLPFLASLSLAIYVHVPTLIIFPLLYSCWKFQIFRSLRFLTLFLCGAIAGVAIIVAAYWLSMHFAGNSDSLDLLGKGYNQYYNVANSIPILHLLSWRVQKINTVDRFLQVWNVAWPVVVLLVIGIGVRLWRKVSPGQKEQFFFINAILLILGWILFGGPAVFYNIHVLPVIAVMAAVLIAPLFGEVRSRTIQGGLIPLLIVIAVFVVVSQEKLGSVGKRLVMGNRQGIGTLIDPIKSTTNPPMILTDEPAENVIAGKSEVRLMTNHLLLFGDENKPTADILREHHVEYLLLYSGAHWRSPFRHIADSLYVLAGERVGNFTDLGRTYDDPRWNELDTLRLYKAE
jgi:hypothetical protein